MDSKKIGTIIADLRKEKGLTQQELADALHVSNKTISKWERGQGCPDVSLWTELSEVLGVEIEKMLKGALEPNKPDNGHLEKVRFHVCPFCGNILVTTSKASISCCGRTLKTLVPEVRTSKEQLHLEEIDLDYYVDFAHEMTKEHYISFVAYVKDDSVLLNRLYPEQGAYTRIPAVQSGGDLYVYCVQHGLQVYRQVFK